MIGCNAICRLGVRPGRSWESLRTAARLECGISPAGLLGPLLLFFGLVCVHSASAADMRNDSQALHQVFGESSLQNSMEVYRRWVGRSDQERYRLLTEHVFPSGTNVIRCDSVFVSQLAVHRREDRRHHAGVDGFPEGGNRLFVPVSLLVNVAARLNKLDDLEIILSQRIDTGGAIPVHAKIVRAFLAIARGDDQAAFRLLGELESIASDRGKAATLIGPMMGLMQRAERMPALREICSDIHFHLFALAKESGSVLPGVWKRQVFAAHWRGQWIQEQQMGSRNVGDQVRSPFTPKHWEATSKRTAVSETAGYPRAHWKYERGRFEKVGGHDRDFLYFDLPLLGDFEVEAIVSGFNYCDTRLGYGGHCVGPSYDHRTILSGHFAADEAAVSLDRPLDEVGASMRVRLVVLDGYCETFVNGRSVCRNRISSSHPWVTVFSDWYSHGWVHNLRISGSPSIPKTVELLDDERLLGWSGYFGEAVGMEGDWETLPSQEIVEAGPGEFPVLQAKQHGRIDGSSQSSLLQYGRSLGEEESISYEFFFREGSHIVHPAIGRTIYWLGTDRDERVLEADQLRSGSSTGHAVGVLKDNHWNQVEIVRSGERLELWLNDQLIVADSIAAEEPLPFGLFYFCDRSTALVRRVQLKGNWPSELPVSEHQELADDAVERLVEGKNLASVFQHDFAEGIPLQRFFVTGADWTKHLLQKSDGVHCEHPGGKHVQYGISPNLEVEGDFDLIAEFAGFEATVEEGGDANVHLKFEMQDRATECVLYRKYTRFAKKELGEQIVQAAIFTTREDHRNFLFPFRTSEAVKSGKLRLVRMGNQVHYLFAANDSTLFQHLHSETVTEKSTGSAPFRLVVETTKNGHASVVWKSLTIRAEQLSGAAVEPSLSVAQLDRTRDALVQSRILDYSDADVQRSIQTFGQDSAFAATDAGLLITAPGSDSWTGHGLNFPFALHGDFDVTAQIDVKQLDQPSDEGESVVYLETEFRDPKKTSIHAKFAISPSGQKSGEVQLREVSDSGEFEYTELVNYPASSVQTLRVARRQSTLYVLIQDAEQDVAMVLGKLEVGDHPILAGDLRFVLHAGGAGRQVSALLKRVTVHADRIDP
ncbi:DUF1583 domain-containing protein [Rhodopirellula bahusiensis]